ncbi:MAG: hypothetical protein A2087_02895 [Spirochaetes bacterium GWD1_61_31]|nr:MAG: hypothetical protein A2Y37_03790 [Spirochaetes bacterium GWB1_60_80]OHD28600.1 MAG: hypothetical protein A2004_06055 [Spirochaetes bacterium GWC1_61_12]OHD37611.1 MAG: hypothetical protein A2087_02895 [Spirochaetes bacterium GWD1_61_31]OHD44333.1 MAG: hypothetical protein A2Y35_09430 [Spirochaetes bacterium GWE1_60_18]OHD61023.1 MAG: hypothetical protein A2Y32_05055 [Spirochaetes bacterium GWF1_60_12]HAP44768.1 hypothetical protein [Spirochaetaceae bacterium]
MLKEFTSLRQHDHGWRRLFFDDFFDLYIWYDQPHGSITGFQLVYNKAENPHSLTWLAAEGYLHNRIDEGEKPGLGMKMSPILVPDGLFDRVSVAARLETAIEPLEAAIKGLVLRRIGEFDNDKLRSMF